MLARCAFPILSAAVLVGLSGVGEAARLGSRSVSPAASPSVGKKAGIKEEAASEARMGVSFSVRPGSASSPSSGSSTVAAAGGVAAGSAAAAAATRVAPDNTPEQAETQSRQVEQAKLADLRRKAEEDRKHAEIERLAKEAEEERQQAAIRLAQEKKKKEQLPQQAQLERRCVLKPVMTDAEIAKCR